MIEQNRERRELASDLTRGSESGVGDQAILEEIQRYRLEETAPSQQDSIQARLGTWGI
jgi:hypothetical protein